MRQPLVQTVNGLRPINSLKEGESSKQFQCQICKSCYAKPQNLRRHMRIHNRERRFKCEQCQKSFFTKHQLKNHSTTHLGIKSFTCPTCNKKFASSSTLSRHKMVHSTTTPYVCPYCHKMFKSVNMCKKHINTHKKDVSAGEQTENLLSEGSDSLPIPPALSEDQLSAVNTVQHKPSDIIPLKNLPVLEANIISDGTDNIPQISVPEVNSSQMELLQQFAGSSIQLITSKDDQCQNQIQTIFVNCEDLQLPTDDGGLCNNNLYPQEVKMGIGNSESLLFNSLQDGNVFNIDNLNAFDPTPSQPTEMFNNSTQSFNVSQIINPSTVTSEIIPDLANKLLSPTSIVSKPDKNDHVPPPIDITLNDGILSGSIPFYSTPDLNLFFNIDADLEPQNCDLPNNLPDINLSEVSGLIPDNNQTPPELPPESQNHQEEKSTYTSQQTNDDATKKNPPANEEKQKILKKKFNCVQCKRGFDNKNSWKKHVDGHNKKPKGPTHACIFCQRLFKKQSDLTRHIRTHTGEKPFPCDKCDKHFSLKSTLLSHQRTHNPASAKNFNCNVCNTYLTSKSSLKVHMNVHLGVKLHTCGFCSQKFSTAAHKRTHESFHHKSEIQNTKRRAPRRVVDMLSSVAMESISPSDLEVKSSTTSQNLENVLVIQDQLQLPNDSLNILSEPNQNALMDIIQLDPTILQQLQSPHLLLSDQLITPPVIQLDDGTFLSIKTLNDGDLTSADNIASSLDINLEQPVPEKVVKVRNLECDICHKKYSSKDVLRKHKKTHGINKKFPCNKCDKGFDVEDALVEHKLTHLGHKPYACMYCSNSFTHQQGLSTHIKRIHNITGTLLKDDLFLYTLK